MIYLLIKIEVIKYIKQYFHIYIYIIFKNKYINAYKYILFIKIIYFKLTCKGILNLIKFYYITSTCLSIIQKLDIIH
jgi:hypothetical protein